MISSKYSNLFIYILLFFIVINGVATSILFWSIRNIKSECVKNQSKICNNEIILPSTLYMLDSIDNSLYFQSLTKRWSPTDFITRAKVEGDYMHLNNKLIFNLTKDASSLKLSLIDYNSLDTIQNINSRINIGKPYLAKDSISIQFLGDSYTQGLYFREAIIDRKYVPKVNLIGSRNFNGIYHEGRGGWTLNKYFSNITTNIFFYNPFYQPSGNLKYWGTTAFWKNCISLYSETSEKSFNLTYSCSGYDISSYSNDGKRANPQINDLMWDSDNNHYIVWTGNEWKRNDTVNNISWGFNYQKYLDMYQFKEPDILVVMLGLNDFRNGPLSPDFTEWNKQVDYLFESYKNAVPNGKMVLCTPCTSCGILDNKAGDFTLRQNAVMWEVRKNIINMFDHRQKEGLYIVDTAVTVDNVNGYRKNEDGIQVGNPHPYLDYPEIGKPIAAFIQYIRNK